ncbi:MAG: T9SS type A sorting domain-containing protein [bacterium]
MRHLLNTNFKSIIVLFFISGLLFAQPINTNGGFEESATGIKTGTEITGWDLVVGGAAFATFEVIDYDTQEGARALSIEVASLDANAWDIQVVNDPIIFTPGATYTYSIWAKADVVGALANFTVGSPTYAEWGRLSNVAMTSDWQNITLEFTVPATNDTGRAPIHFALADNNAFLPIVFYIDDLQITEKVVSVENVNSIPAKFELGQNYPNPFNPETTIDFSIPEKSDVRIELINTLGQVVKEIANGSFDAGSHQVKLNASNLSSGVYFYKLIAGNFTDIKKLVLMK